MARIRGVKPELFRHEGLQELGPIAIVVFIGLLTQADSAGRFRWKTRQLKLDILPFVDYNLDEVLEALQKGGFIVRYEVDSETYGLIPGFLKHQYTTGREPASKLPSPVSGMYASMPKHVSIHDKALIRHTESESESESESLALTDGSARAESFSSREAQKLLPREEQDSPPPEAGSEDQHSYKAQPPDPRHAEFKGVIADYWDSRNTVAMPWDGSEGKALSQFLSQNPHVSVDEFSSMMRNRANSEGVNHGDRPRLILSRITSYASGRLDRFNRPSLGLQPRRLKAVNA